MTPPAPAAQPASPLPHADPGMLHRVHSFDWSKTPLGPISNWPPALRTAVDICLHSPVPMFVWWGPQLINIYNDGYAPVLGKRHPAALGQPARQIWSDIWPHIGDDVDRVVLQGQPVSKERVRFIMERNGYPEETFFSYTHSPIPDGQGGIGGLFQICTDETAAVLAQRARDQAEDRNRIVLDALDEGLTVHDATGAILMANPSAGRILGLTVDQLRGTDSFDPRWRAITTDGDPLPPHLHPPQVSIRTAQPARDFVFGIHRADDTLIWVSANTVPLIDAATGRVTGCVCSFFDVTAYRNAQDHAAELRRKLDSALLAGEVGTFEWHVADDRLWGDDNFARIFGIRLDDSGAAPISQYVAAIHPDDRARVMELVNRTVETGCPYEAEYRVLAGGQTRWVVARGTGQRDHTGRVVRFPGVVVDITDLVRAREAARASEARLRTSEERLAFSIEAADLGTFYCPVPLGPIEWNAKCKEHFWLPPDAHVDIDRFYSIIHPDDRPHTRNAIERAVFGRNLYDVEYRTVAPDGRTRWVRAKGRAYYDDAGNPTRFDGVTIDVTDQKLAETDRQRLLDRERAARADAEAANRAKDRFLAVLSHELRTPLTPVAMAVTAMDMDPRLPFEFRDDIAMVRRNVELETRLIDDLLDLSRVISGKLPLNRQPISLHAVVNNVLQIVGADLHEKHLAVHTDLAATSDSVDADPARLQQVLWNLLKNAAKFTPEGGSVRVRSFDDPAHPRRIAVSVSDTGRGIPPDALAKVFEPFEQGDDEVTRRFGGMGLGLAIAKGVVDLHGGTIHAHSPGPGQGATFTLSLPLRQSAHLAAAAPRTPESGAAPRTLSVLLVEDHADTARLLARLLRLDGMDVHWAGTVADALSLAGKHPFDLIVSDLGLPDAAGTELLRQLRAAGRHTPAIAMSGYGMDDDLRRSREAGFAEHLVKPVNVPQLRQAIHRVTQTPAPTTPRSSRQPPPTRGDRM